MNSLYGIIKKGARVFGPMISDKFYINIRFLAAMGRPMRWKNPTTFNEKLQWMKIYDRNPIYTKLVDKYEVRAYVAETIGEEYLFPCFGVYDSFEEIDFDALPNQFVLKCTHDSGSVMLCRDKATFNIHDAKKHFDKCLQRSSFYGGREWAYKNVKPRIIIEKFMTEESTAGLKDYKFFCFNGCVKALFIATDRGVPGTDVKFDFFDDEFNHLPFRHGHENATVPPQKPQQFEEMKRLASTLSGGLQQVRIDLYNIEGKIYFGEMTFYHHCGFVPFVPSEWDNKFGDWINIGPPSTR